MSDWPTESLGPYCLKIGSGATPRGGSNVYTDTGDVRLIRSQNVYNDGFKPEGLVFIDDTAALKLQNVEVLENDVLLNITGDSVARACLVDSRYLPARVNQHVAIIRPNPDEFDPRFILYFLISPSTQALLMAMAGSGGTRNALTKGMIESLQIPKPTIQEQEELGRKLWLFDQKIGINRQVNKTLEQTTRAIFKSWFVDFEPVKAKEHMRALGGDEEKAERAAQAVIAGAVSLHVITAATDPSALDNKLIEALGEKLVHQTDVQRDQLATIASQFPDRFVDSGLERVPHGWAAKTLASITSDLRRGISPKYIDEGGVAVINQKCIRNHTINFSLCKRNDPAKRSVEGRQVQVNDVLINSTGVGTLGRVAPVRHLTEETVVDSHVTVVRADIEQVSPNFLIQFMLSRESFIEASGVGSTGQTELRRQVLEEIRVCLPPLELQGSLESLFYSLNSQYASHERQTESLAALRDTLLPNLVSGELDTASAPRGEG